MIVSCSKIMGRPKVPVHHVQCVMLNLPTVNILCSDHSTIAFS